MAVINNYVGLSFKDVSSWSSQDLGYYRIYLNKPLITVDHKWKRTGRRFWLNINTNQYFDRSKTNLDQLTINYSPTAVCIDPSTIVIGDEGVKTVSINPVLPSGITLDSLSIPPSPTGYMNHSLTTISSKGQNKLIDLGGVDTGAIAEDPEHFSVSMNLDYVDNLFNSRKPVFKINSDSTVTIKMESNYSSSNFPGGSGLPRLVNPSKQTINEEDLNDVVPYNKNTLTYTLPWLEGIQRDYRLETQVPEFQNSGSNDDVDITLVNSTKRVEMFNDLLHFTTRTAAKLKSTDLKISGNKLSWTGSSERQSYNIYVDGVFRETVTGTTWNIPDSLYEGQLHTYSISVNDWTKRTYYWQKFKGKRQPLATEKDFPALRETYFTIYKGNETAITSNSWTDVGTIEPPIVSMTIPTLNSRKFTLRHSIELDNAKFYYKLGDNGELNEAFSDSITIYGLKVNSTYRVYFYSSSIVSGKEYLTAPTAYTFTTAPYPKPSITGLTRTGINSYNVSFSSTVKPDRYEVYFNRIIYSGDAKSPISIGGWIANASNEVLVRCIYEADQTYNSEIRVTYGSNYTPLLDTPTLTKTDIKEDNYEQSFGDAGSKQIIDNVTTKVELKWNSVLYASGYVLYDKYRVWNNDAQNWEEGIITYPTQEPDADTEYMYTTKHIIQNIDNAYGYHEYSVKAVSAIDEAYNSKVSNVINLEQNFPLNPPDVEWDSPNTYVDLTEKVPNADFYSIQLVPSSGTTNTIFRSFTPEKYPYRYDFYDMVKDLTETESFIGTLFSRSYNAFYFHPSRDSNVKISIDVIKLRTPTNLQYNFDTNTVSWIGDSNAYQYEIKIKAIDGDWVTYYTQETEFQLPEMAPSLYIYYVRALRDDNSRTLPIYIDSDKSENDTFGLINTPQNFKRHINKFSWDSVGADRYEFYEDGESITTVDGGGISLELGMTPGSMYRPEPGHHYYQVKAISTIDGERYESGLSDRIDVDIVYLDKLETSYIDDSSIVSWEALNSNVVYDARVNNISETDPFSDTTYTLDKDEAGSYYFKVRAVSTIDEFLYQTSEFSDELLYNVFKLNRPVVSYTSDSTTKQYVFSWDTIPNATEYYIRINKDGEDIYTGTQSENYYTYFPDAGFYAFTVIAKNSGIYKRPKYIDSEMSNMVKFGVLEAPVIKIEENVISWEENPLVDYYEIYNYNKKFSETDRNNFELDVSKPYSYNITVVAVSNEDGIEPSRHSNSVQYVVTQLEAPQKVRIEDDNYLVWELVLNADNYRIYIDNELTAITSGTKLNLQNIFSTRAGILKLYVEASSNKVNLIDSEPSNFVLKRIEKEKKFNIVINEVNYDKIQLPFTMNFTLDEKLDTAAITLAYIDEKKPFERLTPADIIIYESAGASRKFPMVIESDVVEEIKVGNGIKYKHTIELIERTIILQNEIVPDFSISSSVRDFIVRDYTTITADTGSNIPFEKNELVGTGTYDEIPLEDFGKLLMSGGLLNLLQDLNVIPDFDLDGIPDDFDWKVPTGVAWFRGITPKGGIQSILPKNLGSGELFVLPNPTTRLNCVCLSAKQLLNWILNVLGLDDWVDLIGTVGAGAAMTAVLWKKLFEAILKAIPKVAKSAFWIVAIICFLIEYIIYIVKILVGVRGYTWAGLLEKLMTTDLSIIGDCFYTDDDWAYPRRIYKIRPHHDGYEPTADEDVIKDIPTGLGNKVDLFSFPKSGEYDLILEVPEVDLDRLYDQKLIDFDSTIIKGFGSATLPKVHYMKDKNGNPTMYRVVWSGITVRKDTTTFKHKKISDVLEKVMALTNNKYTMDPKILEYTSTFNCPDMTFSNGNYLYDVLETIGREFYGLPRLIEDNIITFDILDTNTFSTRQTSFWKDTDVLGVERQDLDNVAGGFISNVSNMVPDEDYTTYPAPGMWVSARSDDADTAATYIESMSIAVDKPIYKINKLFVKNAVSQMPDLVLDITNYLYQDVVYNSLNNNRNGKGLALVWSQGKKFIRGLGQLPEASKFYQIVGWGPDEYVIDNIIKDYIKKNLNTLGSAEVFTPGAPGEMLFQVEYQGYSDPMLYIENPEKKTFKYAMYSVFNQEDNTISDTRFSNGALTVLKRHNTNAVQKSYQAYSLIRLPLLGESINISSEPYYIDDLTYEFHNGYSVANCNFSKNYNKINPRTTINSEYRQYELRSDNIVDRSINFNQYCMVGNNEGLGISSVNSLKWGNVIKNSLEGNSYIKPDCFYINCYNSEDLDKIPYTSSDVAGNIIDRTIEGIALPLSYNRIGMSVSFSASMEDNFAAGHTLKRENTEKGNLERVQGYVRYVGDDIMDQTPYMRITLGNLSDYIKNYSYKENGMAVSVSDTFPEVPWLEQPTISLSSVYFSKFFKVYKDQREKLKFNYQMHFISNKENLFLHKGFVKYLFRQSTSAGNTSKPILVGYKNDITNRDIITEITKDTGCEIEILNNKILFKNFVSTNNYKGLALIWPNTKEIILEIRQPVSEGENVSLDPVYFNFSDKIKR